MFENSIDNKSIIKDKKGENIIDLTEPCFNDKKSNNIIYTLKRVPYNMIMRMDLVSQAEYNNDNYTDILLKYNDISNPFTLNYNDILFIPSAETVANDITKPFDVENDNAELIRNYHKYIDKDKVPTTIGSQKNEVNISKNYTEANITPEESEPIVMRNGRIYFGNNSNVECSTDGISASDFAIKKIENLL